MAIRAASLSDHDFRYSFEEEWPDLAGRLDHFLAAKGVERWLRADVIQETATRLYPRWETLDHSAPLWNLVVTIALRVVHNHRRKESRIELVSDPVPIHRDDVHARGLQRAQLAKTRSALQQLSSDQRRVLLAEVGEALLPAGTRNRINVLRLRARANLRDALGPWAPSVITIKFRYLGTRIAQKRSAVEMHAPTMATSLVTVVMAATLSLAGSAGSGGGRIGVPVANPVQAERPGLVSMAALRDTLDPVTTIRRAEPSTARLKDRAKKASEGPPRLVANPKQWVDYQSEWIEDKKDVTEDKAEYTRDKAEDNAERDQEWAEDRAEYTKDKAEDNAERDKEWAECHVTNQC